MNYGAGCSLEGRVSFVEYRPQVDRGVEAGKEVSVDDQSERLRYDVWKYLRGGELKALALTSRLCMRASRANQPIIFDFSSYRFLSNIGQIRAKDTAEGLNKKGRHCLKADKGKLRPVSAKVGSVEELTRVIECGRDVKVLDVTDLTEENFRLKKISVADLNDILSNFAEDKKPTLLIRMYPGMENFVELMEYAIAHNVEIEVETHSRASMKTLLAILSGEGIIEGAGAGRGLSVDREAFARKVVRLKHTGFNEKVDDKYFALVQKVFHKLRPYGNLKDFEFHGIVCESSFRSRGNPRVHPWHPYKFEGKQGKDFIKFEPRMVVHWNGEDTFKSIVLELHKYFGYKVRLRFSSNWSGAENCSKYYADEGQLKDFLSFLTNGLDGYPKECVENFCKSIYRVVLPEINYIGARDNNSRGLIEDILRELSSYGALRAINCGHLYGVNLALCSSLERLRISYTSEPIVLPWSRVFGLKRFYIRRGGDLPAVFRLKVRIFMALMFIKYMLTEYDWSSMPLVLALVSLLEKVSNWRKKPSVGELFEALEG